MAGPQSHDEWLSLFEEYATGRRSPGYDTPDQAIAGAFGAVAIINEAKDADPRSLLQSPDLKSSKPEAQRLLGYLLRGCEAIRKTHGFGYQVSMADGELRLTFDRDS